MKKVIVGLSGGVDSSVAAYLLKKQGYDVSGIFMKNWEDETGRVCGKCPWKQDMTDAFNVAKALDIPFKVIDFVKEYKERVVNYMFAEYEAGRTPNPDILCNREIKFNVFLKAAIEEGADFVATGHYTRVEKQETMDEGQVIYKLLAGVDGNKDQSYFLCQLSQKQLSKAMFPLGEITKPEAREIAKKLDLTTAEKKDSQGICFIGKVDLPEFLKQKLKEKKGNIIEIDENHPIYKEEKSTDDELIKPYTYTETDEKKISEHNGAHFFTVGQRKGLNVGGTKKPLFVIGTNVKTNTIYTGQGTNHPGLFRNGLFVKTKNIHWVNPTKELKNDEEKNLLCRIRYRQPLQKAILKRKENGIYILFKEPQRAVTSGQFVAFYDGEELIGSGVIE